MALCGPRQNLSVRKEEEILLRQKETQEPNPAENAEHPYDKNLDRLISFPNPKDIWFLLGRSLVSAGLLALIFITNLVLVSQVQYLAAQSRANETLRFELANGTAPVAQVDSEGQLLSLGTPVAFIEIAAIGLNAVVVEGTDSSMTAQGPAHRRDTVLPGQSGTSVIYGRQSSFGGVFGQLDRLVPGDEIKLTTGQGESLYQVTAIRQDNDQVTNDLGESSGRLTLVTADGLPFTASSILRIEAALVGDPKITPVRVIPNQAIQPQEKAMSGNQGAAIPLIFVSQALIGLAIGVNWLAKKWGRTQAWLAGAPVLAFLGSLWSNYLIQLLPNLL